MDNSLSNAILENSSISSSSFIFSIIISYLLGYLLSLVYLRQARSLSNHESLARVFPILCVTTAIVIAVVKSSLALSLGLVGALSIVRFRTPIKEPEELTYLFLCIALGLSSGADQYFAAIIGFLLITVGIYLNNLFRRKRRNQNALRVSLKGFQIKDISKLVSIASENCLRVDFNNLIISERGLTQDNSITLAILLYSFRDGNILIEKLNEAFPDSSITIVDLKNF